MKKTLLVVSLAFLSSLSIGASADPWKDESGHGRGKRHGKEYKEEYWDGNCKVERKMNKHGDYKEERKCKAPRRVVRHEHHYHEPRTIVRERVVYPEPPPPAEPGISINVHLGR